MNLNLSNFVDHPCISLWRKIYQNDFQLDSKTHCSSLEALLRRVVAGKKIWNISNVVDLYNCCSILSLLPMGGYDLAKISGDIKIRYAKEGEPFFGLNSKEMTTTCSNHVIYADDKRVLCWLWNYKDCKETSIQMDTEYVLFFIDSFNRDMLERAFNLLEEKLTAIQCLPLEKGILNKSAPCIHLSKVGEMCR